MSEEWREWMAERHLRRTAEGIVRDLQPDTDRLCWVRLPESDERCPAKAALEVYGLPFCEVHGAEVRAGALAELYFDAEQFLDRLDNPTVKGLDNGEILKAIEPGASALSEKLSDVEGPEDELLRRAYPLIRELMDPETAAFDYSEGRGPVPEERYRRPRLLLCRLMRLAYAERATYIVEALEPLRESASEQLAYALQDYEERGRRPVGAGSSS